MIRHIIFGYYKAIDEIVPDLIWALTNLVPKIFFIWGLNFSHCNEFNFFLQSVKSENDGDKCQVFMDENGHWSWKNQTTIETMDQSNDTNNNEQEYFENHSIPCVIFANSIPGMYMQVTACYLQLMIIVGKVCQFIICIISSRV